MSREILKPNHGASPTYTISDYWVVLYRRRWMILLVAAVAAVISLIVSRMIEPHYEAMVQFYVPVDSSTSDVGPQHGMPRLPAGSQEDVEAYTDVLRAFDTMIKIAQKIPDRSPGAISRSVDVSVSERGLVVVYVRDKDPSIAAEIANACFEVFNEFHDVMVQQEIGSLLVKVNESLEDAKRAKREAQSRLAVFEQENLVVSFATRLEELESERSQIEQQIRQSEIELDVVEQRIRTLEEQIRTEEQAYRAGAIILDSPVIHSLQTTLAQGEIELAGAGTEMKPDHPELAALRQRNQENRKTLEQEIRRIVESESKLSNSLFSTLRVNVSEAYVSRSTASARLVALQKTIKRLEQMLASIPVQRTELEQLREDVVLHQDFVRQLTGRKDDLTIQLFNRMPTAVLVQKAIPPSKHRPVFPLPRFNAMIAGLGGLVAGSLYAFFLHHIDVRRHQHKLDALKASDWSLALVEALESPEDGHD